MDNLKSTFQTPHEQYSERNGQPFEYLEPVLPPNCDDEVVGDLHYIKFEDGVIIEAWNEEILKDDSENRVMDADDLGKWD